MAKGKKRSDGRLQSSFTYNGRRYFIYGYSAKELKEKEHEKRTQLEAGQAERDNPTLDKYYKRFTDNRRGKVREMTIRSESFRYKNCADVIISTTRSRLGAMRIRDIKPMDIQEVQNALSKSDRTTETVNNCMDHLSHVFNRAVKDETIDKNPCNCT